MSSPLGRILRTIVQTAFGTGRQTAADRREFARADVDAIVKVYFTGETFEARLRDVSISGALIEPDCGMTPGVEFELELPNIPGRVRAEVMRLTNGAAGIRFANPSTGVLIAGWSRGTSKSSGPNKPQDGDW